MNERWVDGSPDTELGNKITKGGEIGGDKGESIFITWKFIILKRKKPPKNNGTMQIW